jgi:long-chain fatty acid transport protein
MKRFVMLAAGAAAGATSLTAMSTDAEAGAFAIREQSAYSQGASFAGNATCGESVQGMFWNSAIVTCHAGRNFEGSMSLIIPDTDITTLPGSTAAAFGDPGSYGKFGAVPSSSTSMQLTDQLYVGMTTNGPYGLGVQPDDPSAGSAYARNGKIFSINFNPVVGYKVSETLSIGAGLQIQYFNLIDFSRRGAQPGIGGFAVDSALNGDDWGFGFTAGLMWKPMEGTEFGLGYRSSVKHTLKGVTSGAANGPISATTDLPELVTASLRHRLNDRWTVLGTFEWSNWSNLQDVPVTFGPTGGTLTTLTFHYDDGFYYAVGAEYEHSDALTLRAGVAWEQSPIADDSRSASLPDDDRLWLSFGGTYDYNEKLSCNLGYSFITTFNTRIAIEPGNPWYTAAQGSFYGDVSNTAHILAFGAKYKFGHHDAPHDKYSKY